MTSHNDVPAGQHGSRHRAASQRAARQARDNGLRRVRKITWRVGLLSAAAAAVLGAKFAHLTAPVPHLSGGLTGNSAGTGAASSSGIPSSPGIPSSAGVSPASGGGVAISGGS